VSRGPAGPGPEEEIELKFALDPGDVDRLRESPLLAALGLSGPETSTIVSTYWDTAGRDLSRARAALRVRQEGDRFEQTLKAIGGPAGHERIEVNAPVAGEAPELERLPASLEVDDWKLLRKHLIADGVRPHFRSVIERTRWQVADGDWEVEVALDRGHLEAGGREEPVLELELELTRGEARHLFELALRLLNEVPLRLLGPSKAERGARLAEGRAPPPRRWRAPALPARAPAGRFLRAMGFASLEHFLANDHTFRCTGNPEALRRMRGAIRRLRTVVGMSRSLEGVAALPDPSWLLGEYRWMIGEPREAREAREARDLHELSGAVLDSDRATRVLLETGRWLEGLGG
jgi:triphosphatase